MIVDPKQIIISERLVISQFWMTFLYMGKPIISDKTMFKAKR